MEDHKSKEVKLKDPIVAMYIQQPEILEEQRL